MIRTSEGRFLRAALLACAMLSGTPLLADDRLVVETLEGLTLGELAFDPGQEICLTWAHSVTGGRVADCFENRDGTMVLARSFLHDFAAGLGEVAGRGTLRSAAEGGYWIDGIDEAIPDNALRLRIGAPRVGHVLTDGTDRLNLSARAPGASVMIRLRPHSS
ncbi:MAG: DUF1850 domain-containing protein [Paracoccaceae bacterium]|nr:DUF1850 domain-containing protein [Paracoccaceae bacterium]